MSKKVYNSITELIGKTPLLQLNNLKDELKFGANIIVKLEYFNPAGSVKDRIALAMIEDAEKKGLLKKGDTIVEPTSGNTGIGLASVAAAKGYKVILTMPETMSIERRNLLKAYGAELVLTEGKLGMKGAIAKAEELSKVLPAFSPSQFENQVNPQKHYATTGPEIYEDLGNDISAFVSGIGTGGTISGTGKYLKEKVKGIKVFAVEPTDSPILSKGVAGPHRIQGIGAGFVPKTLNTEIYDEIITITNEDALATAKLIAKHEGVLVGISSGAALYAGIKLANKEEFKNKNIVVILPDTGERYLSTPGFLAE